MTFSDVMPAVRATPMPQRTPTPVSQSQSTPQRAKRYTGAHADTVTSGSMAAMPDAEQTPLPGTTPTSGQISASTLPVPRHKHRVLIAALGAAVVGMIAIVVVMAMKRDSQPAAASDALAPRTEPPPVVQKPSELPTTIVDAAVVVEAIDAAPAAVKKTVPVKNKVPEVRSEPVKAEPVKQADPPKQHPKACPKDDPMCNFGTDQ